MSSMMAFRDGIEERGERETGTDYRPREVWVRVS